MKNNELIETVTMPSLPFIMTYIVPVLAIAFVAWLIELYWKKREAALPQQKALTIKPVKTAKHIGLQKQETKPLGGANPTLTTQPIEAIKIIFADLSGTQGQGQSKQIFEGLTLEIQSDSEALPVSLMRSPKAISLGEAGKVQLIKTGQALLKEYGADVLIWGQVFSGDGKYSLSFLKNETKGKDVYSRLLCGLEKIDLKKGALSRSDALAIITVAMAHAFEICDEPQKSKVLALKDLHERLSEGLFVKDGQQATMVREKLWAYAWWCSVRGLQQDHKETLTKSSLLWRDLLKNWPLEESSYDAASARNNLAVVCYFLGENTQKSLWFERSYKQALKAQSYFRKTGYPRRWSELEFLVLLASNVKALKSKNKKLIKTNEAALVLLQKSWRYEDHPNFWMRIDNELDKLRKAL